MANCVVRIVPPRDVDGTYIVRSDVIDELETHGLVHFDPVYGEYIDPDGRALEVVLEAERRENPQLLH